MSEPKAAISISPIPMVALPCLDGEGDSLELFSLTAAEVEDFVNSVEDEKTKEEYRKCCYGPGTAFVAIGQIAAITDDYIPANFEPNGPVVRPFQHKDDARYAVPRVKLWLNGNSKPLRIIGTMDFVHAQIMQYAAFTNQAVNAARMQLQQKAQSQIVVPGVLPR